jgi:hypothetical protein
MAIFGKKGTKMEKQKIDFTMREIEAQAIQLGRFRPITDDETPAAVAALTELVGKKPANSPTWLRRLGALIDGSGFTVNVEVCNEAIVGLAWHPSPNCPPEFLVRALPLQFGVAVLQSKSSPEIELADRRRRYGEFQQKEDAKRLAEQEKLRKFHADREAENKLRSDCRAGDWSLLNALERLVARLAVVVESRDSALASDLRKLVADSLAGNDDTAESWPHTPKWFAGLGLENLSPERRQDLTLASQGEREIRQIEQIPPGKRPALQAMTGNDRSAMLQHWGRIVAANRREAAAPRPANASSGYVGNFDRGE